MKPPKVVVYGSSGIPPEQFSTLTSRHLELMPVPDHYPAERLKQLAPFQLILLNSMLEPEKNLERIRVLRRAFRSVPVILASADPSSDYLVQAYRHGIADCLLAPFTEEQLASVIAAHLHSGLEQDCASKKLLQNQTGTSAAELDNSGTVDLYVGFLGSFYLKRHGVFPDKPGGARQRSLLAYLLYYAKNSIPRDRLLQQFWPDHDPDCARNNLNVAICSLRRYLGAFIDKETICYRNDSFLINPHLRITSDLDEFIRCYQEGSLAERRGKEPEAAQCYRLAIEKGCHFLEEFQQEGWTIRPREEFLEKTLHALGYIGMHRQQQKEYESAIEIFRRMLAIDCCLESAHRGIMACYLALGKKEKAVRQYLECERLLREELDMRPSAETQVLYHTAKGN